MSTDDTRPDLPSVHAKAQDRRGPSSPGAGDLPEHVRRAAEAAHRNWRIGDDGEGRLHAALVVAASLIRADERERIRQLATRNNAICVGDEGKNCYFADLIGEPS